VRLEELRVKSCAKRVWMGRKVHKEAEIRRVRDAEVLVHQVYKVHQVHQVYKVCKGREAGLKEWERG